MKAGVRDRRISIERMTPTIDVHGGEVEGWALYAQEWAHILYGTGAERREAGQERASQAATFRVPSNPFTRLVNPSGYRIQHNQYLWDVVGSVPLGRDGIEITAVSSMEVIIFSPVAAITVVSGATGALTNSHMLSGGIVATGSAGMAPVAMPLAGAVTAGGIAAGSLDAMVVLSGAVSGQGLAAGAATVTFALAGDVIASSSATGVTELLDSEVFADPGFDNASAWILTGAGTSITGSELRFSGGSQTRLAEDNSGSAEVGATYRSILEVTAHTTGGARPSIGSEGGTTRTAIGTYVEYIVASNTNSPAIIGNNSSSTLSVASASFRKVL